MKNLKKLIVYFIEHSPRMLGRTDLMKYVYTFEYYYFQKYKQKFTETNFVRYHYGPNDTAVRDATKILSTEGIISIQTLQTSSGNISYQHKYNDSKPDDYELPEEAELVACFIIDRLGKESYQGVIDFAYDTPPMRLILAEEKQSEKKFNGRVIDMAESEKVFKSTREQKEEARRRLKSQNYSNCSDEKYYENIYEEFEKFEDLRRRVTSVIDSKICE